MFHWYAMETRSSNRETEICNLQIKRSVHQQSFSRRENIEDTFPLTLHITLHISSPTSNQSITAYMLDSLGLYIILHIWPVSFTHWFEVHDHRILGVQYILKKGICPILSTSFKSEGVHHLSLKTSHVRGVTEWTTSPAVFVFICLPIHSFQMMRWSK